MSKSDLHDFTFHLHAESPKAWCVSETGERDDAIWLPKSQCERGDKKHEREPIYEFTMPEWLAYEKGLI